MHMEIYCIYIDWYIDFYSEIGISRNISLKKLMTKACRNSLITVTWRKVAIVQDKETLFINFYTLNIVYRLSLLSELLLFLIAEDIFWQ